MSRARPGARRARAAVPRRSDVNDRTLRILLAIVIALQGVALLLYVVRRY